MKTKIIRSAVRPVILASLATGVVLFCLDAVNASMKAEIKNNVNPLTAQQIVDKIKQHVTCPWQQRTVDTFKAGDPNTPVTGVAVTFMATYDVLGRAARQGCNFIITHEPTFYHGQDDTSQLDPDPVIEAKRKFIKDNNLIVWRFHDHIHRTEPDGIVAGMVELFGWKSFQKHGPEQGPGSSWPLHFRRSRHETLPRMAQVIRERCADQVHSDRRSVLESLSSSTQGQFPGAPVTDFVFL